jgi:toxin-antitoxin system PIN domain toxin
VIGIDTNILVYAHRRDSAWHEAAASLIRGLAEGTAPWAIPWPCVHEFLSTVTHPRIYRPPSTLEDAVRQIDLWRLSPSLVLLSETADYWPRLRETLNAARVVGPQVHDARVAALCRLHGVRELWTADRDFTRFAELTTRNPLVG